MPIGTQTPGSPTTVTPDASPTRYASLEGPAPDGPVVADDVLAALLAILNVQEFIYSKLYTNYITVAFGPIADASTVSFSVSDYSDWTVVVYNDLTYLENDFVKVTLGPILASCAGAGLLAIGFSDNAGSTWNTTAQVVVTNSGNQPFTLVHSHEIGASGTVRVALLVKGAVANSIAGTAYGVDQKRWAFFEVLRQV